MPEPLLTKANRRRGLAPATLDQCFDTFGEREEFPDRKCRNCKATGGVSKVSSLGHIPSHLAVQIRRWRQVTGRRGHVSLEKIDTKVDFPVQEDFDLSPWVSGAADARACSFKYKLYGVVQHHGSGYNVLPLVL
jgi:ubiquitin C-terminal hydrolase